MPKTALSALASSVLLATFASPALAAPTAGFDVSAGPYRTGVPITFTSTSTAADGSAITSQQWDFDSNGSFDATGPTVTRTFIQPGTFQVKLTVTSDELADNQATITHAVPVVTRPPVADFAFNPPLPFVGDDVLFAPDASDPDGDTLTYTWSWGDGTDDSHAHVPVHNFASVGTKTVTLTVTDSHGAAASASHEVEVRGPLVAGNELPVARFTFSPRTAQVGDPVEFASSSYDRDGQLRAQEWDLDGDGEFDDARGDDILYTFSEAGTRTVRLRVTDSAGASAIAQRQLTVTPTPKPRPGFLRPDPKVRLKGLIYSAGTRVQILGVRGPRGALVTVRCKGKGCPAGERRKRIKKGTVRFHNFERFLRAGVRLQIFVTKPGKIGDYTRYTIRRGRSPVRVDRCVTGAKLRPVGCG